LIGVAYSMCAMPDSDQILQRSEMSRWAKNGQGLAQRLQNRRSEVRVRVVSQPPLSP
jgi:hypothetical protein